jgi:hypothetical protein
MQIVDLPEPESPVIQTVSPIPLLIFRTPDETTSESDASADGGGVSCFPHDDGDDAVYGGSFGSFYFQRS